MNRIIRHLCLATGILLVATGCRKSDYNKVDNASYLRVFNTLSYEVDLTTKGKKVPFLTMIIDPQIDKDGVVTGGAIIADFLDVRKPYAAPASNAAGTDYKNTEFPGKLKVPVAPVINGFDLSGWAQVPAGRHRFVFYIRPITPVPFLTLPETERTVNALIADSTLEIAAGEVYTMNLLEKDVRSPQLSTLVYLRHEVFTNIPFADSLLYINFYNLSARGYAEAHPEISRSILGTNTATGCAIADNVNLYYFLYTPDVPYPYTLVNNQRPAIGQTSVPGYNNVPLQNLQWSQAPTVAAYNAIPLFAGKDTSNGIMSRQWMQLAVAPSGVGGAGGSPSPANGMSVSFTNESDEGRVQIWNNDLNHAAGFLLPSLIRQAASGPYLQRSFATVSSMEFINKKIYLTSIQRVYERPLSR
ncbi:hypothetical protein [Chitinophaga sp. ARDCPP14]|uniref:hypothetical protein n=1 Tax=Chitinophaga sp. ARDCPP14 TaxID=3391139 RepID=UPI003F51CDC9